MEQNNKGLIDIDNQFHICQEHQIPAKYFCFEPDIIQKQRIACAECMLEGNHKNHKFILYSEIINRIKNLQDKCQKPLPEVVEYREKVKGEFIKFKNYLVTQLDRSMNNLLQFIDKRYIPINIILKQINPAELIGKVSFEQFALLNKIKDNQQFIKMKSIQFSQGDQMNISKKLKDIENALNEFVENSLTPIESDIQKQVQLQQQYQQQKQAKEQKQLEAQLEKSEEINISPRSNINEDQQQSLNQSSILQKTQFETSINIAMHELQQQAITTYKLFDLKFAITFQAHTKFVRCIENLGSNVFISAGADKQIKIWQFGKQIDCIRELKGHTETVNSVIQIGDNVIASAGDDMQIIIWNIQTSALLRKMTGHKNYINNIIIINENQIASCSNDKTIKIWNIDNTVNTATFIGHEGPVYDILKFNDNILISGSGDRTLRVWNLKNPNIQPLLLTGHEGDVNSICDVSKNEIASGSSDHTIRIWKLFEKKGFECVKVMQGHSAPIWKVIRINDNAVGSCSHDKTIKLWRNSEGECIKTFRETNYYIFSLLLFDDKKILAGDNQGNITIWD